MRARTKFAFLSSICAGSLLSAAAPAQDSVPNEAERNKRLEEVLVTGSPKAKTEVQTAYSTTTLDDIEIERANTNSLADIVRSVPGVTAEGGGGSVAINLFVRGLPQGGQIQLTPLQFDGLPSVSTFGLSQINSDIFIQPDIGIAKMEFVRGGVTNLFGTGSVAGILNFRSKKGEDEFKSKVKVEVADEEGRVKTDFYVGGPVGGKDSGLKFAMSGFYRNDDGPLDSGLDTEGVQLRSNITKEFDDDSGFITLFGQVIDDSSVFFLPLPLDGEDRDFVSGNDGKKITTMNSRAFEGASFETPDGLFRTGISDGADVNGSTIGASFEKLLSDGWSITGRTKYSDYDHNLAIFLDGDGIANRPESQAAFLETRDLGSIDNASFTFSQTGQEVPEDFLVFGNRILDLPRSFDDFTAELNLHKEINIGSANHFFTFGGFFARLEGDDDLRNTRVLGDFNEQSRAIDLVITDPDSGEETIVSRNGVINAGLGFQNRDAEAKRYALYFADQVEIGKWSIEGGVRVERFEGDVLEERTRTFDLSNTGRNMGLNLSEGLSNVTFGDGTFVSDEVEDTAYAASGAVLYDISDMFDVGETTVYANFSRGFFMPQLRSQRFGPQGEFGQFEAEIIKTAEVGVKHNGSLFSGTIAGWWTQLEDRADVRLLNDPDTGGTIEFVDNISTEAFGIETTWNLDLGDLFNLNGLRNFSLTGNLTYQDHEFTEATSNPDQEGAELRRQPNILINNGLTYDDGRFDFGVTHSFSGDQFANNVNTVELDSYNLVNLDAGFSLANNDNKTRIGLRVFNLFDSRGLTEGSPRVAAGQESGGEFFVGRPILPRRIFVSVTQEF